jgi:acyl-CoA synthetase (AMP-forming)/AMP-acid ligase II
MLGLMQHHPLLISSLIVHAASVHPNGEVASRTIEGTIHRCTYADVGRRAAQVANLLAALGVGPGERVGTLAWNGYRHLELFFGVSGAGAVLHTINPRLFPEQLEYIINHAGDRILVFDVCFAPLVEQLAPRLKTVQWFVALAERAQVPQCRIPGLQCYEDLLTGQDPVYSWPALDENSASSLCYTSGTTGNPKGVLYTHRSTLLHSMTTCMVDGFGLSALDSVLIAAPMFHANAWGIPYGAALCGAKLVLPGPLLDGATLYQLLRDERVTLALGVPTVWLTLQQYVQSQSLRPIEALCLQRILCGGTGVPRSMVETYRKLFGTRVIHAWGMTETSPVGTVCHPLRKHQDATETEQLDLQAKQGRPPFGVSLKITDSEGASLAHDGKTAGRLMVRGHWITSGYFRSVGGPSLDAEGWFDTGDIGTLDADGYLQITDRAKDVIKSGGEWISSIELENAAMGHPAVAEAAAIGLPHPRWQERPLLIVVKRPGQEVTREELLAYLSGKVIKWWLPDDVEFVAELPHTGTGKIDKKVLRAVFKDRRFQACANDPPTFRQTPAGRC